MAHFFNTVGWYTDAAFDQTIVERHPILAVRTRLRIFLLSLILPQKLIAKLITQRDRSKNGNDKDFALLDSVLALQTPFSDFVAAHGLGRQAIANLARNILQYRVLDVVALAREADENVAQRTHTPLWPRSVSVRIPHTT